jgi:hypothetical protein
MSHPINITGQRFGRLVAVRRSGSNKYGQALWFCRCACGKSKTTEASRLRAGVVLSCGCFKNDGHHNFRHGHIKAHTPSRTYHSWQSMLGRCNIPNKRSYKDYGGRGIKVCKRWYEFTNFLNDLGECPPGYSIERVNNNGNYTPKNCKWIPMRDQAKNRRKRRSHATV